jgi:hypothetical protein
MLHPNSYICPEGYCQTFVVRPKKPISSFVISIYLKRRHLYMCTRSTLPPGTCPAEPLRTGEYNQPCLTDTLSLMPTFLGRTVQARGEEFVEKLLGGSGRTTIDMAVSKQFAWQLLFAHFANLLHLAGSEWVKLWKPHRSQKNFHWCS